MLTTSPVIESRPVTHDTVHELTRWHHGIGPRWCGWVNDGDDLLAPRHFTGLTIVQGDHELDASPGSTLRRHADGSLSVA